MEALPKAHPRGAALVWELFLNFFKIGTFTIGGGYAMIPIMERVLAEEKKYLTKEEFLELLVIAQTAPGVLATNISVAVGYKLAGKAGSVAAAFGASLPGFLIIIAIFKFLKAFENSHYVRAFFAGAEPVVTVLILLAAWSMAKKAKQKQVAWLFAGIILTVVLLLKLSPIIAIIIGGLVGVILYREL